MLKLTIASPEQELYTGKVSRIVLPGAMGQFEIRKDHAPFISLLNVGTIIAYASRGNAEAFCIDAGLAHINNNEISVLVDTAFKARVEEEEKLRSQQAQVREQLSKPGNVDYAALLEQLAQLSSELNAIDRIRKHRNKR